MSLFTNKSIYTSLCIFLLMFLCGCAASDNEYSPAMKMIYDDENYKKYREMLDKGLISQDGYYCDSEFSKMQEELREINEAKGDIAVTFSENEYIDVSYYSDSELTLPIDTDNTSLGYEDCIYSAEPVISNTAPAGYVFDRFRIFSYDADGNRHELPADQSEKGLVLRIPMDKSVKGISVEPLGRYENIKLSFSDYYTDTDGSRKELTGKWKINSSEITGDTYEIAANTSYSVQYTYDNDKYYFVSSVPEAMSENSTSGIVYFDKVSASDETDTYSVELHRYIAANFTNTEYISSVSSNGTPLKYENTCRLKAGDTIVITSENKRIYCDETDVSKEKNISGGFDFKCIVPDDLSELTFKARGWYSKKVNFDIEQDWFDKINALGWFSSDEEKLVTIKTGDKEYTYKKIKNSPSIDMKESDDLRIIVSEDIKNFPNLVFEISVNGANPEYIGRSSDSRAVILSYEQAENVRITERHGYVFSDRNIDNGELEVQYKFYDLNGQRKDLTEGQFLEEGSRVEVIVSYIPDGYEITGGAVLPGEKCGTVEITDKTQSSDFVVNSRKISD